MDPNSIDAHVKELEYFLSEAKHPLTQTLLQEAITSNKISSVKSIKPQTVAAAPPITTIQIKTYGWDQSTKNVIVYLTDIPNLEDASEEQIISSFSVNSVTLKIVNLNNRNYNFNIKALASNIQANLSKAVLKRNKIVVTMPKAFSGKWEEITLSERKSKYERDEKDRLDDPALQGESDPSANVKKMLEKMYEQGNDNMKREISKMMYETQTGKPPNPMEPYS